MDVGYAEMRPRVGYEYLQGGLSLQSARVRGMWRTAAGVCIGILAALAVLAGGTAVVLDQMNDGSGRREISPEELDRALNRNDD
jgi:hypothetical protein